MANVVIKRRVAAFNVDSYNRSVIYTGADLENGTVFALASKNATEDQCWAPTAPTAKTQGHLWMATAPEVVYQNKAQGGTVDPRDYVNKKGIAFDATLLQYGDIIEMTGEGIDDIATKDYLMIDPNSFILVAADSGDLSTGLTLHKVGTGVLHIGDGAIAPATTATYIYEVTAN